jgi:SAM-dependent methyltransferase
MNLKSELDSWNLKDKKMRELKLEREWVRYPYLIEKLGLDSLLYLEKKTVLDIGSGPMGGIIQLLPCERKISIDPLNKEYVENFPEFYNPNIEYFIATGEKIPLENDTVSLVTCVNALDHSQSPQQIINETTRVLEPSGYLSLSFCINLAKNHPHEAHIHNLDSEWLHKIIDSDYETIFEKVDKYGWVKHNNKVGQPCLYGLYRLTTKK